MPIDPKNKPSVKPEVAAKKFRFKLLAGQHVCTDPTWVRPKVEGTDKPDMAQRPATVTYAAGEVIETDTDLIKKFGAEKFQLLSGGPTRTVKAGMAALLQKEVVNDHPGATAETDPDEDVEIPDPEADAGKSSASAPAATGKNLDAKHGPLENLTLADLRKLAGKEGVDLSAAHTKAEIIDALKAA